MGDMPKYEKLLTLKERVDRLVAKGWSEEGACNYIERCISENEEDDDPWFMVYDRKQGKYVDLRLED